ncbi:hypothetical protein J6590_001585 [Homalodisca vitripennis]|nr:hypothetical protein J6590_001585 [Homalodisca vitripennis]
MLTLPVTAGEWQWMNDIGEPCRVQACLDRLGLILLEHSPSFPHGCLIPNPPLLLSCYHTAWRNDTFLL